MKTRFVFSFFAFCIMLSFSIWGFASDDTRSSKNIVALFPYNLQIKIPPTWVFLPTQGPHYIAALASSEHPTLMDTRYNIFIAELKDGLTLNELMDRSAKGKAYQLAQRNLIKLGKQEEIEVAGLKGREDMFSFTVDMRAFMYVVVGFEKGGMGYILDFWSLRGNQSKMAFDRFRNWLKSGVSFIDPNKDVSEGVKFELRKADESFSRGADAATVPTVATTAGPIRNIADFTKVSYGEQKQYMEKNLPENTEVLKLSKQAMLAEHSGNFKDAKGYYEKLLPQKESVTAAYGVGAWAMLHSAVQRTSEVTGDETREKEMLVWLRDNMFAEDGLYHKYLGGLMPPVQDHLKERLKKYQI